MIAEAIDTALSLGWALAVWIVLMAVVAGLALYAVVIAVWLVARGVWRACRAAWRGSGAPHSPSRGSRVAEAPPEPSQGRSRPAPAWARTDKEAA